MKVIHKNNSVPDAAADPVKKAKELESEGRIKEAIAIYEKLIKNNPVNEAAYNRLIILHRKEGDYKKEKAVINAGIKAFQQLHKSTLKLNPGTKVKSISNAIAKATGLVDKKGTSLYEREPIGKWRKRMEIVNKKLGQ